MPNFNFSVNLKAKEAQSEAQKLSKDILNVTKNLEAMAKRGHDTSLEMDLAFRRMSKRAEELNNKIKDLKEQQNHLRNSTTLGAAALDAANFAASKFAYVVGSVAGAVALATRELLKFGDVSLKAFAEREGQVNAYKQLFKQDLGEAETAYGKGLKIGQLTDLTSSQVLKAQGAIYTAGYHGKEAEKLLAGGLDVATAAPEEERSSRLKMYTDALRRIKGRESLSIGDLNRSFGAIGIDSGLIKKYIAQSYGFQGTHPKDISDFVDKKLSGKDVRPDVAMGALKYAISTQFNQGGKLGGFATSRIGSIASLQSNREEAFENIQKSYNADMLPSVKAYKDALRGSTAALDFNTKTGNNFRTVLADLANTSIGLKAAWENFTTGFFESFSKGYTDALNEMGVSSQTLKDNFGNAAAIAKELGSSFKWLGTLIAKASHSIEEDMIPALQFTKAIWSGNFKEAYAIHKEIQTRELGKKVKEVNPSLSPAKSREEAERELERFGTNEGIAKGGGRVDLDGNIIDGFGNIIKRKEPDRVSVGKKKGRGEGGTGGSAGGAGDSGGTVVHGGGMKIGTMHLEMHLHGNSWDEVKHIIASEATGEVKQLFEKLATEMGV